MDFVVADDGRVELRPASYDIRDLAGILARPGQGPVSVDRMNQLIRGRHGTGR